MKVTDTVVTVEGTEYRITTFSKTPDWETGDLLEINGKHVLFLGMCLIDKKFFDDIERWEGFGAAMSVIDETGIFHQLTSEELFDSQIKVIAKFSDATT